MAKKQLTRRTFITAGAVAAATAASALLGGCGSDVVNAPVDGGDASEAPTGDTSAETSPNIEGTALETIETSGDIAYAINCSRGDLSPWGPDALAAACINLPVLEGLYEIDPITLEAYPALAAGSPTEITTNVYEIRLRDYAFFSDGTPVTADDVVASFKLASNSAYGAFSELLSFIAEMEATSEDLVTVVAKVPMDDLLERRLALVKVVPASTKKTHLSNGVPGTGAWCIDSIDDTHVVYTRNTYYTGSLPALVDSLTCYFMPDTQDRLDALAERNVQAIEDAPTTSVIASANGATANDGSEYDTEYEETDGNAAGEDAESVDAPAFNNTISELSDIAVETVPGFNPALLAFNTRKAPFDDARVRQAILYAIDPAAIAEEVFEGGAHAATCFLDEGNPDYQKASSVYAVDLDKARSLLEAAGVDDLSFVLDTGQEPWMGPVANMIAEQLGEIDVAVEVHTFPLEELYEVYMDADEDVQTFSLALTTCDPTLLGRDADLVMRWFFSDDIWMEKRTGWKSNGKCKELQRLMTKAATTEEKERATVWKEAFDLVAEQVPLYPILHCDRATAYRPAELSGFEPSGAPGIFMLDASVPERK